MKIQKRLYLSIFILLCGTAVFVQKIVTGMLTNSAGNKLQDANILVHNSSVGENIVYSTTSGNTPDTKSTQTGLVWCAIIFNPAIPVNNPDETWGTSQADNQLGDINNPITTVTENQGYNNEIRLLANGYIQLKIINGLRIRDKYGYSQNSGEGFGLSVATPTQTRGPFISTLGQSFSTNKTFLEEYYFTYDKVFNNLPSSIFLYGFYRSYSS